MFFAYSEKETSYLKAKDAALAKLIEVVGLIQRPVIPDLFMALVHAILGQQISTKAHATVWRRAQTMFAPITPANMAGLPVSTLQTCGISMRKAVYIHDVADRICAGELDLDELQHLNDETVCQQLCQIRGIGVWTAEMLMTFSMQRMDILSWGDLAIQRGLRMLYRHKAITPALFTKYKKRYSPYATVASLYLWALAGGAYEGYADPAPQKKSSDKSKAQGVVTKEGKYDFRSF
ncbi:DNA-3-methyladenine glycosylase [Desulfovibrionales bacterium]